MAEHFSPTAKARMDELVANLLDAYRDSIENLEWMTEGTRAEALKKLSGFTPKIGFPEKWKDYSAQMCIRDSPAPRLSAASATFRALCGKSCT